MSEGKRPGGLTALAVLNFVFGGFFCLATLSLSLGFAIKKGLIPLEGEDKEEAAKAFAELPDELIDFLLLTGVYAICAFLLIATGVGYLKQKKFWGRWLGNAGCVLSIAGLMVLSSVGDEAGDGFNLGTLVLLVYPVLSLILLNTTFRDDFVR